MDIEKLVEEGARSICRSGKFESGQGTCSLLCMESLGDVRKSGCSHSTKLHGTLARAVGAVFLKAAAEEAEHEATECGSHFAGGFPMLECQELAKKFRTLAAQLGGSDA